MSLDDDRQPDPEAACAERVLTLVQAMAQASSVMERIRLAREARTLLAGLEASRDRDDTQPLKAARRTLDDCRELMRPSVNRRPV